MGWDLGAIGGGMLNFATAGIPNIVTNFVSSVQQGRPLDAAAGLIVGMPTGALVGGAQAVAGVVSGVTGNSAPLSAVQGFQNTLNTFSGATAFAGAAIAAGGALGSGGLPSVKPTAAQAAPAQKVVAVAPVAAQRVLVRVAPESIATASPLPPSGPNSSLLMAGGALALAVVSFLLFRK